MEKKMLVGAMLQFLSFRWNTESSGEERLSERGGLNKRGSSGALLWRQKESEDYSADQAQLLEQQGRKERKEN